MVPFRCYYLWVKVPLPAFGGIYLFIISDGLADRLMDCFGSYFVNRLEINGSVLFASFQ